MARAMEYLVTSLVKASYVNPKATKRHEHGKNSPQTPCLLGIMPPPTRKVSESQVHLWGKNRQPRAKVTPPKPR